MLGLQCGNHVLGLLAVWWMKRVPIVFVESSWEVGFTTLLYILTYQRGIPTREYEQPP